MPGRITLLSHGRTTARPSAFPDDEPLAADEAGHVAAFAGSLGRFDHVTSSPAEAARQTAAVLSEEVRADPRLADIDLGRWRGRTIAEIEASDPGGLDAWLNDPDFAGHGGESRAALRRRVADWLAEVGAADGHLLAVTHPAVIQSAMLAVLGAPAAAFRSIDVPPLCALDIRGDGRRWTIRSFGRAIPALSAP